MYISEDDLQSILNKNPHVKVHGDKKSPVKKPKKKNKYNAKRIKLDGICFDSQKEAEYYSNLKLLVRSGAIDGFTHHGNMIVAEGIDDERGSIYETDFIVFYPDGHYEVVDTKGVETDVFKVKMKVLKSRYPHVKIRTV